MKKLGIFLMSVLAAGFTACDDYDEAAPQSSAQAPLLEVGGVTVTESAIGAPINLETLAGETLELITTVNTPKLPEGVTVQYSVQVATSNTYADAVTIALTDGCIAKEELDNAFRAFYGKAPYERDLYFRFIPFMSDGTSRVRIGGADEYLLAMSQKVTPVDLGIEFESKYYLLTDLGFNEGWESKLVEFEHSGADPFDDPVYTLTTRLEAGEVQIIGAESLEKVKANPEDAYLYWWGSKDDSNALVQGLNAKGIVIEGEGKYQITVNMLDYTYEVVKLADEMYMIGIYGWNWKADDIQMVPAYGNSDEEAKYWCVAYCADGAGFKFCPVQDWKGDFGYNGAEFESHVAGVSFTSSSDGNFMLDQAGWYLFGVTNKGGSYTVELFPADVWVYGVCTGLGDNGWTDLDEWKFTVPADGNGEFVSPALAADGALRLCVHPMKSDGTAWLKDWWRSEFIFFDGAIAYRGMGGDQDAVLAWRGQKVYLNFKTGEARAE